MSLCHRPTTRKSKFDNSKVLQYDYAMLTYKNGSTKLAIEENVTHAVETY